MSGNCVYGPVPSRRLGRSLGVDLVPFKVCTYDCIYCQLGATTLLTLDRGDWVSEEDVLRSLKQRMERCGAVNYIALAGSGEPTLNRNLGRILRSIKTFTGLPLAVITNGSLLGCPEVREDLMAADVVMPSLDAGNAEAFRRINRPHPHLTFEQMVVGLEVFCQSFQGETWLEVMLVEGLNDSEAQIEDLASCIRRIRPSTVDLNTVVRPAGEAGIRPVPRERLEWAQEKLPGIVRIIATSPEIQPGAETSRGEVGEALLALLSRRPCTLEDAALGLGRAPNEVLKALDVLVAQGHVERLDDSGRRFFRVRPRGGELE